MEFKGTKEKWLNIDDLIFSDDYFNTHIAVIPNSYNKEISKANALLISKAPEMLEMLIRMRDNDDWDITDYLDLKQLIKEATEL
jgi:hypothetical protein